MPCRGAATAPYCSKPSAYSMSGVIHSTWQRFDDVLIDVQAAVTSNRLDSFFHGWDQVGGGPCRGMRQRVCGLLQADPVAWHNVHFAAEALQELCWERLHTGHWMDVPVEWRDAYALYTLLSVVSLLAQTNGSQLSGLSRSCQQAHPPSPQQQQHEGQDLQQQQPIMQQQQQQQVTEGLRQLDLATLMGGLRFRPLVDKLIDVLDCRLQLLQQEHAGDGGSSGSRPSPVAQKRKDGAAAAGASSATGLQPVGAAQAAAAAAGEPSLTDAQPPLKQQKLAPFQEQQQQQQPEGADLGSEQAPAAAAAVAEASSGADRVILPPGSLTHTSAVVPVEHTPSMEHFLVHHLLAEGGPRPVVLRGVMQDWPAMTRWQDLDYLRQVAGRRTVPVEVGSHYLAEGWGTQLMTLGDFIATMMAGGTAPGDNTGGLQQQQQPPQQPAGNSQAGAQQPLSQQPLLYLAQHQLFEQVPALAADILTPDYCMLGQKGVSSVNAWFGPAGTVTPLHQDPEHNLLAQVVGRKYVRLYDPLHTHQLAPHQAGMHTNASRVDLHSADVEARFPGFREVPYTDVVLGPGDMLYMPPRWWHFVQSLSVSFSVSFWWS